MDWTRMFERSYNGNEFGLVFVEVKTWLLRVQFFCDKSALSLVEGITWLREFVRTNTGRSLPTQALRRLRHFADCFRAWSRPQHRRHRGVRQQDRAAF